MEIIKRTNAQGKTQYFGTHTDAVLTEFNGEKESLTDYLSRQYGRKEIDELLYNRIEDVKNVTWEQLVTMRSNNKLHAGQWYRITDYVTTTIQHNTRSAGHAFDILVMAVDTNMLSEEALAIQHSGDKYFSGVRLESWKLNYCLDNDIDRFSWADSVNGRGVIYYMKDEWGNSCGYDFKNIQFLRSSCTLEEFEGEKRYIAIPGLAVGPNEETLNGQDDDDTIWVYTFSCLESLDVDVTDHPGQADASIGMFVTEMDFESGQATDYNDSPRPYNNEIEQFYVWQSIDDEAIRKVMALPNITFQQFYTDIYSYHCSNNHIGSSCHDLSCSGKIFYDNSLTGKVENSYLIGYIINNSFSGDVYRNTFSGDVGYNSFSGDVYYTTFSGYVEYSTFSGDVYNNSFSGDVGYNSFSGDVDHNSFSGYVKYSTFSGYVGYNIFSGYVKYSTFSGDVYNNSFSGDVYYTTFSGEVTQSSFTASIYHSQIMGKCSNLSFGKSGESINYIQQFGCCTPNTITDVKVATNTKYVQVVTSDVSGEIVVKTPYN